MEIGLYEAVSGMKAQAALQDSISANLARVNVPGNKAVITAFELPQDSDLQKNSAPGAIRQLGLKGSPLQSRSVIDFSPGLLEQTNDQTNFAIEGNGFFKIREPNGDISYTRNGQFHLDQRGQLVTGDGAQVLLQNDVPLNLNPKDNNQVTIDPTGKVLAGPNHTPRGALALVHTGDDRTVFTQTGNGRFKVTPPDNVKKGEWKSPVVNGLAGNGIIRQGYLEQSNADSIKQMVSLVQVVRSYEANQKMTQEQDSATGKIIDAAAST